MSCVFKSKNVNVDRLKLFHSAPDPTAPLTAPLSRLQPSTQKRLPPVVCWPSCALCRSHVPPYRRAVPALALWLPWSRPARHVAVTIRLHRNFITESCPGDLARLFPGEIVSIGKQGRILRLFIVFFWHARVCVKLDQHRSRSRNHLPRTCGALSEHPCRRSPYSLTSP